MNLTATTDLYGLIGTPISHSFSPSMHNKAFEKVNENACYLGFDTNIDKLEATVQAFKTLNVKGWNVTMPLKSEMIKYCDELSPEAELIGAVNTIVNQNGKLKGYSTDGIGFFANAKDKEFNPENKTIVLIGAGGAARSIAAQSIFENINELIIYNRTFKKAQQLKDELNEEALKQNIKIRVEALSNQKQLEKDIKESDLVINATSVGMRPDSEEIIFNPDWLSPETVIADIVYTPVKTKLEKEALSRGCKILDGLGMVLWQGAYAFKYWTGKEFPVDYIKKEIFNKE